MKSPARHPQEPRPANSRGFSVVVPVLLLLPLFASGSEPSQPVGGTFPDVVALSTSGYSVDRWTVAGGGGQSSGGAYAIRGSIGQADADALGPSTGGTYEISGGFWGDAGSDRIFANGFESP